MDSIQLLTLSKKELINELQELNKMVFVDVRPNPQYCRNHIKHAENINFSGILLRRLMKGVVKLDSLIPSFDLSEKITQRDCTKQKLVLYDSSSTAELINSELVKHAEVLSKSEHSSYSENTEKPTVYFLDGGLNSFLAEFPHLCEHSNNTGSAKSRSPLGISVSTSLPISLGRTRPCKRLQTPSEDDSARFGPPIEILPHIVLGCERDSSNLTQLRKMGITAVLNVSNSCPNHFETLFEYKSIPVQDSYQADLLSKLQAAFDFINSIKAKGGRVFVHCHAGISRSATVCIAYVMKHMQWDLSQSYEFVKQKRQCISPNLHFMGQLLEFQKQLQANINNEASRSCSLSDSSCESVDYTIPEAPLLNGASLGSITTKLHIAAAVSQCRAETPMDIDSTDHGSVSPLFYDCNDLSPIHFVSAPTSLNYDNDKDTYNSLPLNLSRTNTMNPTQTCPVTVATDIASSPEGKKLNLQFGIQLSSTDSALYGLSVKTKQPLSSISLPTTPVTSSKNSLPRLKTSRKPPASLQLFSPCRVAAAQHSFNRDTESGFNFLCPSQRVIDTS